MSQEDKTHRALCRTGHACGRRRVARLMRARGLAGRVRGRRRPWTTDSDHAQPIAPNRLGQRATPVERPNELWAADITCVPNGGTFSFVGNAASQDVHQTVGAVSVQTGASAVSVTSAGTGVSQLIFSNKPVSGAHRPFINLSAQI